MVWPGVTQSPFMLFNTSRSHVMCEMVSGGSDLHEWISAGINLSREAQEKLPPASKLLDSLSPHQHQAFPILLIQTK